MTNSSIDDNEIELMKNSNKEDDLDAKLRVLKPVNKEKGEKLRKAFKALSNELKDLGIVDYKKAKEEYFNDKYNL